MKIPIHSLKGFHLRARDGEIGKIKDILFDDHHWGGRWVVADTHTWLPGRKVLLSPISFETPDMDQRVLPVRMTTQDIEDSPPLEEDAPVSMQYEKTFYDQFYWPYYWLGGGLWANQTFPIYLDPNRNQDEIDTEPEADPEHQEHVLRSADELRHYRVTFRDSPPEEEAGSVTDLVLDTETWAVPYLILQNREWLPSRKILVPREKVIRTEWKEHAIHLDITEDALEQAPGLEEDLVSREMEDAANRFFAS